MANLKKEYTDIRDQTHTVEHMIVPTKDKTAKEKIVEELLYTLTRTDKKISV